MFHFLSRVSVQSLYDEYLNGHDMRKEFKTLNEDRGWIEALYCVTGTHTQTQLDLYACTVQARHAHRWKK